MFNTYNNNKNSSSEGRCREELVVKNRKDIACKAVPQLFSAQPLLTCNKTFTVHSVATWFSIVLLIICFFVGRSQNVLFDLNFRTAVSIYLSNSGTRSRTKEAIKSFYCAII
jgi:hypothetical protein